MKQSINTFFANHIFVLLCVLLIAYSSVSTADSSKTDWVKDEILQQLSELRKEVKSLRSDISRLDKMLDEVARPPSCRSQSAKAGVYLTYTLVMMRMLNLSGVMRAYI